jgi:hypothetical protein
MSAIPASRKQSAAGRRQVGNLYIVAPRDRERELDAPLQRCRSKFCKLDIVGRIPENPRLVATEGDCRGSAVGGFGWPDLGNRLVFMLWWALQKLKSSNPKARGQAAAELGPMDRADVIERCVALLKDREAEARRADWSFYL